jgi:hypothetical protein
MEKDIQILIHWALLVSIEIKMRNPFRAKLFIWPPSAPDLSPTEPVISGTSRP